MPVSNEKQDNFLQAINRCAEEQKNKIEAETHRHQEEELNKAELAILEDAYALIQKEMAQMRMSIAAELSQKEAASRRRLFLKRQAIEEEVFRKAAEKIREFRGTGGYRTYLEQSARELRAAFSQPGTVLDVSPEDGELSELLQKTFGDCRVETDPGISLGGVRGENQAMGLVADLTLDTKLQDQREWFAQHSGMKVV